MFADDRLDDALDFRRDQLVLGLRRKFRVRHLDRQHRGQSLARIVADGIDLFLFDLRILHVLVQRPRQRGAKTRQMGTAVALRDVVGVAKDIFLVRVVPLHRYLDADTVHFHLDIDNLVVNRSLVAVQMFDESAYPAVVFEQVFLVAALVEQVDPNAGVEERQFAQALGEYVVVKFGIAENFRARFEAQLGTGLVGFLDRLEFALRLAQMVLLHV